MNTTVDHFLRAERITLAWGEKQHIKGGGILLAADCPLQMLQDVDLHLERSVKRQRRDPPEGQLVIGLEHAGRCYVELAQPGQFLFEVLRMAGIEGVNWVVDDAGTCTGADLRLWRSQRFVTLSAGVFPYTGDGRPKGNSFSSEDGLSIALVDHVVRHLAIDAYPPSTVLPLILSPLLLEEAEGSLHACRHHLHQAWIRADGTLILPLVHRDHWTLLLGAVDSMGMTFYHLDGLELSMPAELQQLTRSLASHFHEPFRGLVHERWIEQQHPHTCGTIVIAHLSIALGLQGKFTRQNIADLHTWLQQHDHAGGAKPKGPGVTDKLQLLAELLETKGVPSSQALERASVVQKAIGVDAIAEVLAAKNPWQILKAEASRPKVALRLLTQEEQANYIAERAKQKYGAGTKVKKAQPQPTKGRKVNQELRVDPAQLQLIPGHFVDQDGDTLEQITYEEIKVDATGIALCTREQAQRHLQAAKNISTTCLALLIPQELAPEEAARRNAKILRFSAQYMGTHDPVILTGTLIQLGDSEAEHKPPQAPTLQISLPTTAVVRLMVYKDEFQRPWEDLLTGPLKLITKMVPSLTLCKEAGCGQNCPRFHAPVDEDISTVIHEVWARRLKEDTFSAFLRIAEAAVKENLAAAEPGIYIEPRDSCSNSTSPDFAVIWLSEPGRDNAVHKLKVTQGAVSVVRLKNRYGIRVHKDDEERVHKVLRPDMDFVGVDITQTWRLHPLPHGLQRGALCQLLKEWGWAARPLQPGRGAATGATWEVGSKDPPPRPVLSAFGEEVMISLLKEKRQHPRQTNLNLVPLRAQKHMLQQQQQQHQQHQHKGQTDPGEQAKDPWHAWPTTDPWAAAKGAVATKAKPPAPPVQQRIEAVTKELKEHVQQHLQHSAVGNQHEAQMRNDATQSRFEKLEAKVTEMAQHQGKVNKWMQEATGRMDNTEQQLQIMSKALEQQTNTVQQLGSNMQQFQHSIQGQVQTIQSGLGEELGNKFDALSGRLEALLEKRGRTE